MTILFPGKVVWDVGNWVVRRFIDDAARHLDEAPTLAPDIEDALLSGISGLNLSEPTAAMLEEAVRLVDQVIAANLVSLGNDFHDPSVFPIYLEKLRELRGLILAARPVGSD